MVDPPSVRAERWLLPRRFAAPASLRQRTLALPVAAVAVGEHVRAGQRRALLGGIMELLTIGLPTSREGSLPTAYRNPSNDRESAG